MADKKQKTPSEQEAEQKLDDAIGDLDEIRRTDLRKIAAAQRWKSTVLEAERERLEAVLTGEHPRVKHMQILREHYEKAGEAIDILVKTEKEAGEDDEDGEVEEGIPSGTWELSGRVRSEKLKTFSGLKVILEPQESELPALEANCEANGLYRIQLGKYQVSKYEKFRLLLKVTRAKKIVYTAPEPVVVKSDRQERIDIDL